MAGIEQRALKVSSALQNRNATASRSAECAADIQAKSRMADTRTAGHNGASPQSDCGYTNQI